MNRICAGPLSFLVAMISLSFASNVFAKDDDLFYRGGLDGKKIEAPNGAIVNEDYKKLS